MARGIDPAKVVEMYVEKKMSTLQVGEALGCATGTVIHHLKTQGVARRPLKKIDWPVEQMRHWYEDEKWIVCVFPREKHRPACYTAEGDANLLSSPASVDLGGVFITPVEKDFLKITAEDIAQILNEVSLSAEDFHQVRQRIKEKI